MPFVVQAKIEGLEDVLSRLAAIQASVAKKLLKKAINGGTRTVLRAAKAAVPRKSGLLRRSLGRSVSVDRHTGAVTGTVGPRKGYGEQVTRDGRSIYSDPIKYAHLVEFGTRPHGYRTRKGQHPGAKAYPFLGPAWAQHKEAVRQAIIDTILAGIEAASKGK